MDLQELQDRGLKPGVERFGRDGVEERMSVGEFGMVCS